MRRTIRTITAVLLLAGGAVAAAQVAADRAQASADRRTTTAAKERTHDLRDVATLQSLASRFDAARGKDAGALRVVRGEFRALAMKERAEGRTQVVSDPPNPRPSPVVTEESRREIAVASAADSAPAMDDGSAGVKDDPKAAASARIQMRRQEIVMDLRNLGGSTNTATLDHERALLGELIALAKAEGPSARPASAQQGSSTQKASSRP